MMFWMLPSLPHRCLPQTDPPIDGWPLLPGLHWQYPKGPPGSSRDKAQSCLAPSQQVQGFPGRNVQEWGQDQRGVRRRHRGAENGLRR
ncbi:unnamed protein product [Gulo gulo]|uniref:Uncharacterized protein n=1 Tax=Gulo gulo TaxID=48420 RepID=A0A9X9LHC6_GULGU|nr:unnamed protein product [Gulo gulo]